MKDTYILMISLILLSCQSSNSIIGNIDCNENLEFKEKYFFHLRYVDKNIATSQDSTFRKSVIFLSNYAPISTDYIFNYSRTYPIGIFEKDRVKILEWYEQNKCSNIKFKSTYIVPDAYQLNKD
jgi:hypothetical protein